MEPLTRRYELRCGEKQLAAWEAAAKGDLAPWARRWLDAGAHDESLTAASHRAWILKAKDRKP